MIHKQEELSVKKHNCKKDLECPLSAKFGYSYKCEDHMCVLVHKEKQSNASCSSDLDCPPANEEGYEFSCKDKMCVLLHKEKKENKTSCK